ncbi:hypothetical protein UG55_1006321 [Frankia sp. EI5c]|uniref:hypothetical protein n=1 Tax=Frankia sp. EI5c TaxID=683316 RepID=UPI0007C389C6|nr:hypothetical protein [Frankia sp. EI5c]OAA28346.1 hypothetical protein UG55_1006321 [Frankia sp. EI5c]
MRRAAISSPRAEPEAEPRPAERRPAERRPARRRAIAVSALPVVWSLCASLTLIGCGGAGGSGGAPAPARAGSGAAQPPATAAAPTSTAPGAGGGGEGSTAAVLPRDDSPAGAGRVVEAYFSEINAAAQAGRVADISTTALPGCQTCALDVGVTRRLDQIGARAAAAPYEITGLSPGERRGTVVDVQFTATARTVRLLDPAGRDAGEQPGVPARPATARLALTGPGWRIQNITYTAAGRRS